MYYYMNGQERFTPVVDAEVAADTSIVAPTELGSGTNAVGPERTVQPLLVKGGAAGIKEEPLSRLLLDVHLTQ